MKISELHSLIGRPAFVIGDCIQIKETKQIGWVSHINLDHEKKQYTYMVVNEEGAYINATATNSGFSIEEIKPDEGELADVSNCYSCRSLFLRATGNRPAVKVNKSCHFDSSKDRWICWLLENGEWQIKGEFKDPDNAIMMAMSYRND